MKSQVADIVEVMKVNQTVVVVVAVGGGCGTFTPSFEGPNVGKKRKGSL